MQDTLLQQYEAFGWNVNKCKEQKRWFERGTRLKGEAQMGISKERYKDPLEDPKCALVINKLIGLIYLIRAPIHTPNKATDLGSLVVMVTIENNFILACMDTRACVTIISMRLCEKLGLR